METTTQGKILEKVLQVVEAGKHNNPVVLAMVRNYIRNPTDSLGLIIDKTTKSLALRNNLSAILDGLYSPFPDCLMIGEHSIGLYAYAMDKQVNFSIPQMTMGLVAGPTGSGKSTMLLNWVLSICNKNLPGENVCIITPKQNSEWRNLMPFVKKGNLLYFIGNFYMNPLEDIPGVHVEDVIRNFATTFIAEQRFMEGVGSCLFEAGMTLKQKNPECTIPDLIHQLETMPAKSMSVREYIARTVNRLKAFHSELRNLVDVIHGISIEDICTCNWIFEFPVNSETIFNTFSSLLLNRMHLYKTSHIKGQNLIILEDILSASLKQRGTNQYATEQPVLFHLNTKGRYAGMKIIHNVQGLSQISDVIKQNSALVCVKGLTSIPECHEAGNLLNLTKVQSESLLNLKINEAFVADKMRNPHGVKIITQDFPKLWLTDEEVSVFDKEAREEVLQRVVKADDGKSVSIVGSGEPPYHANIIIQDVLHHPYDLQRERQERLKMNPRIFVENYDWSINHEWLMRHDERVNLGKGRPPAVIIIPTEKSMEKFGRPKLKGKNGHISRWWVYRVAKWYEARGFECIIEYYPPDQGLQSIDLVATNKKTGERHGVEVDLHQHEHILVNAEKLVRNGFTKGILALYSTKLLKWANKLIATRPELEKAQREGKLELKILPEFLD